LWRAEIRGPKVFSGALSQKFRELVGRKGLSEVIALCVVAFVFSKEGYLLCRGPWRNDGEPKDVRRCLISSIKVEVKKKHFSFGWNFSCFAAHLIERELF
jgi:hypothetical protein